MQPFSYLHGAQSVHVQYSYLFFFAAPIIELGWLVGWLVGWFYLFQLQPSHPLTLTYPNHPPNPSAKPPSSLQSVD